MADRIRAVRNNEVKVYLHEPGHSETGHSMLLLWFGNYQEETPKLLSFERARLQAGRNEGLEIWPKPMTNVIGFGWNLRENALARL